MTATDTISYYDENAAEFFEQTVTVDMSPLYERFLAHVSPAGHILDAGCGSGRDARAFLERGFKVTAFDASAPLAKKASDLLGQVVLCCRFDEISFIETFDAVWACASLLHVKERELEKAMEQLVAGLKPGGTFYASFKKGTGERTDPKGRHFTDMTKATFQGILGGTEGLTLLDAWETLDQRPDRQNESWWNFISQKQK
jgi:SAM-dependent methyltransferase